jgi:hypothetical protein
VTEAPQHRAAEQLSYLICANIICSALLHVDVQNRALALGVPASGFAFTAGWISPSSSSTMAMS